MTQQIQKRSRAACWIEAMRLRTLPVSVAGVVAGAALALLHGSFRWLPVAICFLFAVLAQIASNFANEYFDYRDGLDRPGREGPRRGVTEGDITPRAMLMAAMGTLGAAALIGLLLIYWGGWWILAAGAAIVAGAIAYSAGPYPLSRHGLGEVAVILFFGVAPVSLTFYLQTGYISAGVLCASVGIGLLGANVLIVNNYRDRSDDAAVGKHTLAVILGPECTRWLYIINALLAAALVSVEWHVLPGWWLWNALMLIAASRLWLQIGRHSGAQLNPYLGKTAVLMLAYTVVLLLCCAIQN